jgi:SUKH-4 immunity protein of toxin-antitoxin system
MAIHVALGAEALDRIGDPAVRAAVAGSRVRADGYLLELNGLSGTTWVPEHSAPYLVLGTVTEDEQLCLDTRTGAVVSRSTWDHDQRGPANRDLPSFARSLDIFEDSLPFYAKAGDHEVTEGAAARFAEAIRRFDDTVDEPESFWWMITQDVSAGDYNAADLELE